MSSFWFEEFNTDLVLLRPNNIVDKSCNNEEVLGVISPSIPNPIKVLLNKKCDYN